MRSTNSLPAHETGTVTSGDVTLFYRRFGETGKLPILILHGLSYFSYDWIGAAQALADDREIVAMDLRGFGESSWSPDRDYRLETFANDVLKVLESLGWDRAILMGHSFGGRISLATTAWHINQIAGLVCVDFAPDVAAAGRRKVAERIGRQPDRFDSVADALAYHGRDSDSDPNSAEYKRYEAFLKSLGDGYVLKRDLHFRDNFKKVLETGKAAPIGFDLWGMLANLSVPTLILRGMQSEMFALETVEKCRKAGEHITICELAGSNDLIGDNPGGTIEAVKTFLERIKK